VVIFTLQPTTLLSQEGVPVHIGEANERGLRVGLDAVTKANEKDGGVLLGFGAVYTHNVNLQA
jgi:hypothetical protein